MGVARALAADPPVLLMDEPFSAIDPIARGRLQAEFLRLQQEIRKTIVFVTHDLDEAIRLGDRVAVFRQGGHLEQIDPPARILGRPATGFVADFVGSDRALRRLAVTLLSRDDLEPPRTPDAGSHLGSETIGSEVIGTPSGRVRVGSPLRQALAALLAQDRDTLDIYAPVGADAAGGRSGRVDSERDHSDEVPIGVLTPVGLHAALRRSVAADNTATSGASTLAP
ncbi:hypothetical protein FAIPA1_340023 [Frankia sp. AiPs1]|nr:hypothetical protein [Frankia sp. AiPa1]